MRALPRELVLCALCAYFLASNGLCDPIIFSLDLPLATRFNRLPLSHNPRLTARRPQSAGPGAHRKPPRAPWARRGEQVPHACFACALHKILFFFFFSCVALRDTQCGPHPTAPLGHRALFLLLACPSCTHLPIACIAAVTTPDMPARCVFHTSIGRLAASMFSPRFQGPCSLRNGAQGRWHPSACSNA